MITFDLGEPAIGDRARGLEAVHDRHANVHQHDMRRVGARTLDGRHAVGHLPDHLDAVRALG
jgi:hypothetical protein